MSLAAEQTNAVGAAAPSLAGERRSPVGDRLPEADAPPAKGMPSPLSFIEPLPRHLTVYETLDDLADRVAMLLAGRAYDLAPGSGCFAHTDTFPKVAVYALRPGEIRANWAEDVWIGAAVLHSPGGRLEDMAVLRRALDAARARRG